MTTAILRAMVLAAGVTALGGAAFAEPVQLPTRKAGLWEIKVVAGGPQMPAQTILQCIDEATDKDMASTFSPMAKEMCSQQDMTKTATGMVIDSTCKVGSMTSVSHSEYSGDFNSAYTVNVSAKNSGGPAGMPPETNTSMNATWLGACKPDQKPGDIVMPGGIKINIKDMKALRAMAPKAKQ